MTSGHIFAFSFLLKYPYYTGGGDLTLLYLVESLTEGLA
jgi:hypothetical protein